MTLTIRTMDRAAMAETVDWAAAEGWNPGLADAECFTAADPQGFMGGWIGDRMVAAISVVTYGDAYAHLGFYIVAPAARGQGHGIALWNHALAHAGDRTVGLDGVVARQENYQQSGFALAYRNVRYGGVPDRGLLSVAPGLEVREVGSLSPGISVYDRFPAPRETFLRCWLGAPGHVTRAAYRDDKLVGYGVIRPCRTGWKIGPLFADDRAAATAILRNLIDVMAPGEEMFLDVPEPNDTATGLATDLGLKPVFETARMYRGTPPDEDIGRVFGITSFELG